MTDPAGREATCRYCGGTGDNHAAICLRATPEGREYAWPAGRQTTRSADKCERCGRFASTIAPTYGLVSQGSEPSPYYWCAPCREVKR